MSRDVTLFSSYSQRENRITNYCLLMLKMIYESNPNYLGEVFSTLIGENIGNLLGVSFRQQQRSGRSVPDGLVLQRPVSVYIETKDGDWFYDSQLERHLEGLSEEIGTKVLLALGHFEAQKPEAFERIESLCKTKYADIEFKAISFEDFLCELRKLDGLPKDILDAIEALHRFFDEQGLLPTWKHLIDIVSCSVIPEENLEGNAYMCPATGGPYSHSRCRYFGMYREKRVERVAEIEAVVDVDLEGEDAVLWINDPAKKEDAPIRARRTVKEWRPDSGPTRVLLLGELHETNFIKESPGGLRTKTYMNVASLEPENVADLAEKLRGKTWSQVQSG